MLSFRYQARVAVGPHLPSCLTEKAGVGIPGVWRAAAVSCMNIQWHGLMKTSTFFFAMELETRCMELEAFAPAGNNYFLAQPPVQ